MGESGKRQAEGGNWQGSAPYRDGLGWMSYLLLCASGLTIAFTWLGPRAGDGLTALSALVFWAAHVFPSLGLLAVSQLLLARARWVAALPGIFQVVLSAGLASVLFTPLALVIDVYFQADGSVDDEGVPLAVRALSEYANFAIPLVLTWLLINAPSLLKLEAPDTAHSPVTVPLPKQSPVSADAAEFWSRLPGRLGRDVVALSAELHYLRVFTTQGEALILFPFGRAIKALDQENGMQVHRSHWVSLDHVDELATRNGRLFCDMVNGPSVPVSRSYRSDLRSAVSASA